MRRDVLLLVVGLLLPLTATAAGPGESVPAVGGSDLARIQRSLAAREYQASATPLGLQAPNRAHDLRSYFGPDGVRVHDRTDAGSPALLGLRLTGLGRSEPLVPVQPGVVTCDGARVEIRRPRLTEWFVNSEAGLEQGFTLAERPAGPGELVLELSVADARASLAGDRVLLAAGAGRKLAYGGLVAIDARGEAVLAHFEVPSPERLRLVVDDARAVYPLTIDPLLTQTADAQLEADQNNARLGISVAGAGDVNGDGYADVIVGADRYDAGSPDEGAAFIFHGSASGIASAGAGAAATQLEANQGAALGFSVAGAGDVNGDGYDDVIVGAPTYTAGENQEGAAFLFHGSSTGIADGNPGNAAAQLESNLADAEFGFAVATAGDVNGDGYSDVIVGAYSYDSGGQANEGGAFVFLGSATGVADGNPTTANAQIESNQADARLGTAVASAGDVNGDGYADVIAGARFYDSGDTDEGAAFVFLGSSGGITGGGPGAAATTLQANQDGANLGISVAGAGDVNGDGYSDVIVGAKNYNAGVSIEGAAFVFLGSASGIPNGNPTTAAGQLESDQGSALLGQTVAGAGDVNGDGFADVLAGAPVYDGGETDEGAIFVFLGGPTGVANGHAAAAFARLESNQADAWLGYYAAGAGDVNGDGFADVIGGAYFYDAGESNEGAAFVYHGGAHGVVDGSPANAAAQLESDQDTAQLGFSVAGAGDVNADGYSDVIVGAPFYDAGQTNEGAAFVFHGSATGIADGNPGNAAAQLESDQAQARFGRRIASAGDVNGDGYGDVIVGASLYGAGQLDEGAAFVFLGSAAGIGDGNPTNAAAQLESNQVSANLGAAVASAGDVNRDGFADVIVGAAGYDSGESDEGAAFVFLGSATGIADGNPGTAAAQLESDQADSSFGATVAGAGDVNGDGFADVIIGAHLYDAGEANEGAAFVFHGSAAGVASGNAPGAAAQLESDQANAELGLGVASAGDANGDGYADVIVGVHRYNGPTTNEGIALVFHGSASGISDGSPATAATRIDSDQNGAELGTSVASAGDVNGDGFADVIVGAPLYDVGASDDGAAFVFRGSTSGIANGTPATAAAQLESGQGGARMGKAVAAAGDVDGDGFADVIAGADGYDGGLTDEGAAFVFHGGGNQTGRPVLARQIRGNATTPIQPWGRSHDINDFRVRATATHPLGRGRVKLQVQDCPVGVPFGHASCSQVTSANWTDVTATAGGVSMMEWVTGVGEDTLRRWRARVLYAPFRVTQPGISPPVNPAHGPWRRLFGQAVEADVRIRVDTDGDGISNGNDTDDDGDGLLDVHETNTGIYVSPTDTGTNSLFFNTDADGLSDGAEVALGTNPNDPDHDDDGDLDGADSCPFIQNPNQENADTLPAGDACQCGDVNNDGFVNATDVARTGENLVGRTLGGTFLVMRCNVIGPNGGGTGDCDVRDLYVMERFANGQPVTVLNACQAYLTP